MTTRSTIIDLDQVDSSTPAQLHAPVIDLDAVDAADDKDDAYSDPPPLAAVEGDDDDADDEILGADVSEPAVQEDPELDLRAFEIDLSAISFELDPRPMADDEPPPADGPLPGAVRFDLALAAAPEARAPAADDDLELDEDAPDVDDEAPVLDDSIDGDLEVPDAEDVTTAEIVDDEPPPEAPAPKEMPRSVSFDLALRSAPEGARADDVKMERIEIVGGERVQPNEVFDIYAAKRAAVEKATLRREHDHGELRDWQFDLGPLFAPAGFTTTLTFRPQCLFRCDKVVATDSFAQAGQGTRIMSIMVGRRVQRVAGSGTLTAFFSQTALGNGQKWDTCQPFMDIAVQVSFVQQCTFDMTIFGKAVY